MTTRFSARPDYLETTAPYKFFTYLLSGHLQTRSKANNFMLNISSFLLPLNNIFRPVGDDD